MQHDMPLSPETAGTETTGHVPGNSVSPADRPLIDKFGREITYLRVSVTDRCDLRCNYCMPEKMQFLPRADLLSLEELEHLITVFVSRGVRKIRLTGGEPLVRKGIDTLIARLGLHLASGALEEITLTTNGTQLAKHARSLAEAGIRRINISLDTLDRAKFMQITRRDALDEVLRGIDAAQAEGIRIKINIVAVKGVNEDEIADMIAWAHGRGFDVTLIETMPMGNVDADRFDQYLPLSDVRQSLEKLWTLKPLSYRTGGPARYYEVEETGGRLGLITPLTQNFCDGCNRVRLTCTGQLYMCLGQEDRHDLRAVLREQGPEALNAAIDQAILRKPKGHDFVIDDHNSKPAVPRTMSATGG